MGDVAWLAAAEIADHPERAMEKGEAAAELGSRSMKWWSHEDSNLEPPRPQRDALSS
jgi:hypothetical protein